MNCISHSWAAAIPTVAAVVVAMVVGSGCYARTVPIPRGVDRPPASEAPATRAAVDQRIGIRSGESAGNVPQIDPSRVVERFATRLAKAAVFTEVVYPFTSLAGGEPDVLYDVSVTSSVDLHPLSNLVKDIAGGVSVLLLQPALPTTYELDVEIAAIASSRDGRRLATHRASHALRFETTWLTPPAESLRAWHEETADGAIEALVAAILLGSDERSRGGSP